jgi:mRNA interferase RelE/StbE
MKWSLQAKRSVERELRDLPTGHLRAEALTVMGALGEKPFPVGSKKLKGLGNLYLLRVGEYRIVYRIDEQNQIIEVIRVRHRKDVYRGL